jgi:uncharacterized membrane protein YfcA
MGPDMITDISLYLVAIPALLITGISKGGCGGGLGVVAVPFLALVIDPVQAAAIMLPILCLMDLMGIWAYRGKWDNSLLKVLLPAAVLGILLGTLVARYLDASNVRLLVGTIAIAFSLNYWFVVRQGREREAKPHSLLRGGFWAAVAGFTSFVSHAGGPPANAYLLSLRLPKTVYQATTVAFFITVNYVKLIPYAWLGQFDTTNLATSLALLPLAVVGMGLGIWLHHRVPDELFYRIAYSLLMITGLKLFYDGILPIIQ